MNGLRSEETPDEIVVYFSDAIIRDLARMQLLGKGLLDLCHMAASGGKRLVVDFSGVQLMSSAMIGKFVLLKRIAKQHSVPLEFRNLSPAVREVFGIVRRRFRGDDDDDDGPDLLGNPVPRPKPPSRDGGRADPPKE